jgi:hypothetical protein
LRRQQLRERLAAVHQRAHDPAEKLDEVPAFNVRPAPELIVPRGFQRSPHAFVRVPAANRRTLANQMHLKLRLFRSFWFGTGKQ